MSNLNPSLQLQFAKTKRLDPRITYTNSSANRSYFDTFGVMRYAGINEPIFDHDPATGESLGLSSWEARTNLALRSQEFDNASWTKTRSSVVANQAIAPDGTVTMDQIVEDTSGASHYAVQSFTITAGNWVSVSLFVKRAAGARHFAWTVSDSLGSNAFAATFDLSTGTATLGGNTGTGAGSSVEIQDCGNSIYRCSVTGKIGAADTAALALATIYNGTAVDYTGDGTSGLYFWGAQIEQTTGTNAKVQPSPYIATTSATVTRAADLITIVSGNFGTFSSAAVTYSQAGTVMTVTDAAHGLQVGSRVLLDITSGTGADIGTTVTSVTNDNTYVITTQLSATTAGNATRYSGFSSPWYNQEKGTILCDAASNISIGTSSTVFALSDNTSSNRIYQYHVSSNVRNAAASVGGVTSISQAESTNATIDGDFRKTAQTYGGTAWLFTTAERAVVTTSTSLPPPTVNRLYLGVNFGGATTWLNGSIKSFTYFPVQLSAQQITGLVQS